MLLQGLGLLTRFWGFSVQGLGFLTRFWGRGLGFFTPHQGSGFWFFDAKLGFGVLVKKHKIFNPKSIIFIQKVIIWHALALQHALEIIKSSVKYIMCFLHFELDVVD